VKAQAHALAGVGRRTVYGAAAAERTAAVQSWNYGGGDVRGGNVGDGDGVHSTGDAAEEVVGPGPAQARGASRSAGVELDEWVRRAAIVAAAVASCTATVVVAAVAVAVEAAAV
jgi:hypothetical protein